MKMTKKLQNIKANVAEAAEKNGWDVEFEIDTNDLLKTQFLSVKIERGNEFGRFTYTKRGACLYASGIHVDCYTPCEKVKKSQGKNLAWWMAA
jgi:hypothetical protein